MIDKVLPPQSLTAWFTWSNDGFQKQSSLQEADFQVSY